MQNSVPKGVGGMVAVLGSEIEVIKKIINENKDKYECFIANDNSVGQIVLSGKIKEFTTRVGWSLAKSVEKTQEAIQ